MALQLDMKNTIYRGLVCALLLLMTTAANAQSLPQPDNVLQLSSSASVEVSQDLLSIAMYATRDGLEAGVVQAQLIAVLDTALAAARKSAQAGSMEVRTSVFTVSPKFGRDGRISGWVGSCGLVIEGRDMTRVSQAAGSVPGMIVQNTAFRLSRERRQEVESQVQRQAVDSFTERARDLANHFGFTGYTLREVSVQAQDLGMFMSHMMKPAIAEGPLPVEAGKTFVTVNVSGSVQLR